MTDVQLRRQLHRVFAWLDAGDIARAGPAAEQLVRDAPGFAPGWSALSEVWLAAGMPERAAECAERALALEPGSFDRRAHAARCRLAAGAMDAARGHAEAAGRQIHGPGASHMSSPPAAQSIDTLATVLGRLGEPERALALYRRAADAAPENAGILFNLATSLRIADAIDEAEALFERVLAIRPDDPETLQSLVLMRRQTESHNRVPQLERALQRPRPWPEQARLYYSLGKSLEDLERYGEAFEAYRKGAARVDANIPETAKRDADALRAAESALPVVLAAGSAGDSAPGPPPLFIVGLPRSGSTLLERMLGAHPALRTGGELGAFMDAVRAVSGVKERLELLQGLASGAVTVDPARLRREYLARIEVRGLALPGLIDKMPSNLYWVPLIHRALPQARILLTRRDPMDNGLALFTTLFVTGHFQTFDLDRIGRHLSAFERLAHAFDQGLPANRFRIVDYEDLVAEPERCLRDLTAFCGLAWDPACLRFHESRDTVQTASAHQVRQPVHRRSVGRWRHYAEQLEPLRIALGSSLRTTLPSSGG